MVQPLPGLGLCRAVDLRVSFCLPVSLSVPPHLGLFLSRLRAFSYSASRLCFNDFLSYLSTSLCLWRSIFCPGILVCCWLSLSFCLCGFSDSGLLGYDFVSLWLRVSVPGPRSDSSGPPNPRHVPRGIRLCLCSCLGLPHPRRARPPSPTPAFGLSDRPGFVSCASAPRPAPSGVSAALRRPLSAWVFPPPLSLG